MGTGLKPLNHFRLKAVLWQGGILTYGQVKLGSQPMPRSIAGAVALLPVLARFCGSFPGTRRQATTVEACERRRRRRCGEVGEVEGIERVGRIERIESPESIDSFDSFEKSAD